MGAWHQDDEVVEQTIRSLRKCRRRSPTEPVEPGPYEVGATFIPDFLAPPNVPADISRRHDYFVQYAHVLAPLRAFPQPETPISQALLVSIFHLVTMVFNDGVKVDCLPRDQLRHAEPEYVLFVLRHLQAIPLQDVLFGEGENDQLFLNLVGVIEDVTTAVGPDDAPVVTAGFKLLSLLSRKDRASVLALAIHVLEPIGMPFFKRVAMPVGANALVHYLVAQDVLGKN